MVLFTDPMGLKCCAPVCSYWAPCHPQIINIKV
jgi:hypothetical protein